MPKSTIHYICTSCGYETPQWLGRCSSCGEWNTLLEERITKAATILRPERANLGQPHPLSKVTSEFRERLSTGSKELDRALGGGIVLGSIVLVGGEPGIGKSTLMLQTAGGISQANISLYVSGEESIQQIKLRAERLGINSDKLIVLPEINLKTIEDYIKTLNPKFVVIDSIQTIYREEIPSASGSLNQVRECANYLMHLAKASAIPIFLIGHVTKEGAIAGPKVLEHLVDTVLYFEGERYQQYRILRTMKNRFGSTNEVGIFEMREEGLCEVVNPSKVFLAERPIDTPGSLVVATIEGTRPLLVELQALVSPAGVGIPRRTTTGIDYNRALIVIATLEKRLGLHLYQQDVYLNVAGGVRVEEPAVDLGMACAIASSFKNKPIRPDVVVIGEIGLTGEVRPVSLMEKRIMEACKLGFKKCIVPQGNKITRQFEEIDIIPVKTIKETLGEVMS